MMGKVKRVDFFHTLVKNGWMPTYDEKYVVEEALSCYHLTLIAIDYDRKCIAHIAERPESIMVSGHLGVSWMAVEYEYQDRPLTVSDLEDMIAAVNCAEKNLLAIGIPFQDNKNFHGTQEEIDEKIKRNNELRKQWNLDEIEANNWEMATGEKK